MTAPTGAEQLRYALNQIHDNIDLPVVIAGHAGDIRSIHLNDANGKPAGGVTIGRGFVIQWQDGPLGRGEERIEPNGAFVEDLVLAVIDRMDHYQSTEFKCRENALTITHLQEASHWLGHRREDRERRGVQGLHEQ